MGTRKTRSFTEVFFAVGIASIGFGLGALSTRFRRRGPEAGLAREEAFQPRDKQAEEQNENSAVLPPDLPPQNAPSQLSGSLSSATPARNSIIALVLTAAAFTAALMGAWEMTKQFVVPDITIWESHIATIIFTVGITILVTFFVGYRLKLLNADLHSLNAELWGKNNELIREIRQRQLAEARIRHIANHDALTGLPNRILLQDRMQQAFVHAHREHTQVAALLIDLDYFKHINDSLGHHVGDRLLQIAARRLHDCLRQDDSVARLGGDEFVAVVPLTNGNIDAELVAQKILNALKQPFIIEEHKLNISGSVGISLYPNDGDNVESLMRAADAAMYHGKEKGRGNFQFFTAALNQAAQQRLKLQERLRHAVAFDELILYYQPKVEMKSGAVLSAEALLRWRQPDRAPIPCAEFISSAEETALIVPIGEWVLREACKELKRWRDEGHSKLRIAVNLSSRQLYQPHFANRVKNILEENGIPGASLELEITEHALMQHSKGPLETLAQLNAMGITLTVDDFGTGYSSLAYLQRFPIDGLKIDRSFVHALGEDRNAMALVTAIIAMADGLRLKVTAEGVETPQQAEFLMSHDCAMAQGHYYSQPVSSKMFTDMLRGAPV